MTDGEKLDFIINKLGKLDILEEKFNTFENGFDHQRRDLMYQKTEWMHQKQM